MKIYFAVEKMLKTWVGSNMASLNHIDLAIRMWKSFIFEKIDKQVLRMGEEFTLNFS